MSSIVLIAVVVFVAGLLVAYLVGFSAGQRDGVEEGRKQGKREKAIRAYAVGFERGKQAQDKEEEETEGPRGGCGLVAIIVLLGIGCSCLLPAEHSLQTDLTYPAIWKPAVHPWAIFDDHSLGSRLQLKQLPPPDGGSEPQR